MFHMDLFNSPQTVHGWYFLLSENIGRRKHLQAHNKRHLVVDTDDWPCYMSETTSVSEFSLGPQQDIPPHSSVVSTEECYMSNLHIIYTLTIFTFYMRTKELYFSDIFILDCYRWLWLFLYVFKRLM
jgi:hypothetical protein